jgi:hypothetical protein
MKITEITQGKISNMQPGNSAEIDHGDGTKTVVDLKKNPAALQKDPATGKVKLNKKAQPGKVDPSKVVKPGDDVEMGE